MTITDNIIILTDKQAPSGWAEVRTDIWLHPDVEAVGETITTFRAREGMSDWAERITENTVAAYLRQYDTYLGEENVGRRYYRINPLHTHTSDTSLSYDLLMADTEVLRGRAVTHPEEHFADAVPDQPDGNRFFVTVQDGAHYLASSQDFPGATSVAFPSRDGDEWTGFAVRVLEDQAQRLTRTPQIHAQREEIARLRAEVEQQRRITDDFVKAVKTKAREAKIRGWCGEVETMLTNAGVDPQWPSTGTVTVEVTFTDKMFPLARSANAVSVANSVMDDLRKALPEGYSVRQHRVGANGAYGIIDGQEAI